MENTRENVCPSFGLKSLIAPLIAFIACMLAGFFLIIAVYTIPVETMHKAAEESANYYNDDSLYPSLTGDQGAVLDRFTDALMVGVATFPLTGDPLQDAMRAMRLSTNPSPIETLYSFAHEGQLIGEPIAYTRYWHGYLLWLKPMLAIGLNVNQISYIWLIVEMTLVAAICVQLARKRYHYLIPAFLAFLLAIYAYVLPFGMEYWSLAFIMLDSTLFVVSMNRKESSGQSEFTTRIIIAFLLTGMLTSYSDFLTYPIASYGLPMAMLLAMRLNPYGGHAIRHSLLIALYGLGAWGIGYVGMWASKWVVASIILDSNAITDAFTAISERAGSEVRGTKVEFAVMAKDLMTPYTAKKSFVPVLFAIMFYVIRLFIMKDRPSVKKIIMYMIPFVVVFLVPFGWYAATMNHSSIHVFMTFRTLGIAIAALLFALAIKNEPKKRVA